MFALPFYIQRGSVFIAFINKIFSRKLFYKEIYPATIILILCVAALFFKSALLTLYTRKKNQMGQNTIGHQLCISFRKYEGVTTGNVGIADF